MTLKKIDNIDRLISYVKLYDPEIWTYVNGYKGVYEVSNKGRIRSIGRTIMDGRRRKGSIRKLHRNNLGYIGTILSNNSKNKFVNVHRLVAEAFIPNPENKPQVNHKDGNPSNNHATNLEWATRSENILHSYRNGFHKPICGEEHGNSKLTENEVLEIRATYKIDGISQNDLAEAYDVSRGLIGLITKRKRWKHI